MLPRTLLLLAVTALTLALLPLAAGATDEGSVGEHCWDHPGDTQIDGRADIVEHCVIYNADELVFKVRVTDFVEPASDPGWKRPDTRALWRVRQDPGPDLTVVVRDQGAGLVATISDQGGRLCDGLPDARNEFVVAWFPGDCLDGDPKISVNVDMTYQTQAQTYTDIAPGPGQYTDPVARGQAGEDGGAPSLAQAECFAHPSGTVVDGTGAPHSDAGADRADIVKVCLDYTDRHAIMAVQVADPVSPLDDAGWGSARSGVEWTVHSDRGAQFAPEEFTVRFFRAFGNLRATVSDFEGRPVGEGDAYYAGGFLIAAIPPNQLNTPPAFAAAAQTTYDTAPDDTMSQDPTELRIDRSPAGNALHGPVAMRDTVPPRIAGTNRFATAAMASAAFIAPGVDVVYIATGLDYPDALAGGVLAGMADAPVLLVTRDLIPDETRAELQRLQPGRIVALGGAAAIGDGVLAELDGLTSGSVTRLSGADRFQTAARISQEAFGPDPDFHTSAFVATGLDFPDALAGVPPAGAMGAPILLTLPDQVPTPTLEELNRLDLQTIFVLGGPAVISPAVVAQLENVAVEVIRISGPDRFATSVAAGDLVTGQDPPSPLTVLISTGLAFPDALAAGAIGGSLPGPVYLVAPEFSPPPVLAELDRLRPDRLVILGGNNAVSPQVEAELRAAAGLD